jgi:hypothetical protein
MCTSLTGQRLSHGFQPPTMLPRNISQTPSFITQLGQKPTVARAIYGWGYMQTLSRDEWSVFPTHGLLLLALLISRCKTSVA